MGRGNWSSCQGINTLKKDLKVLFMPLVCQTGTVMQIHEMLEIESQQYYPAGIV